MLNEAGFVDVEWVAETGFNSSPVTKGVLFRARKSALSGTLASLHGKKPEETKAGSEEKSGQEECST
jgi:hypothetical protein